MIRASVRYAPSDDLDITLTGDARVSGSIRASAEP